MRPASEMYKNVWTWLNRPSMYKIDPFDISWWMARGLAAGSLMEEEENRRPGCKERCGHGPFTKFISWTGM
jgi:hypothetical protein